jgi:hypothetical protein
MFWDRVSDTFSSNTDQEQARTPKLKKKAFNPSKRTSSTSKYEIYLLFIFFVGHFCLPGSVSRDTTE